MRYWWVNQNQTYRHEVQGGYLWSPKRNANGARNAFYESMREVAPGDLIFSFNDTRIQAIGIAQSYCWENPKPTEFGNAGQNWENIGWKVTVQFTELINHVRPKNHIGLLGPLLPKKYAPLQPNGNGLQADGESVVTKSKKIWLGEKSDRCVCAGEAGTKRFVARHRRRQANAVAPRHI